jgi:thiol-disulfide isomerase/thioredoxin
MHASTLGGARRSTIALAGLRGQVLRLDFWGTFCEPCKKSFPKLEALNRRYATNGLHVIGISEDEEDDKGTIPLLLQGEQADMHEAHKAVPVDEKR